MLPLPVFVVYANRPSQRDDDPARCRFGRAHRALTTRRPAPPGRYDDTALASGAPPKPPTPEQALLRGEPNGVWPVDAASTRAGDPSLPTA
jgi:hypothetical protein